MSLNLDWVGKRLWRGRSRCLGVVGFFFHSVNSAVRRSGRWCGARLRGGARRVERGDAPRPAATIPAPRLSCCGAGSRFLGRCSGESLAPQAALPVQRERAKIASVGAGMKPSQLSGKISHMVSSTNHNSKDQIHPGCLSQALDGVLGFRDKSGPLWRLPEDISGRDPRGMAVSGDGGKLCAAASGRAAV